MIPFLLPNRSSKFKFFDVMKNHFINIAIFSHYVSLPYGAISLFQNIFKALHIFLIPKLADEWFHFINYLVDVTFDGYRLQGRFFDDFSINTKPDGPPFVFSQNPVGR